MKMAGAFSPAGKDKGMVCPKGQKIMMMFLRP